MRNLTIKTALLFLLIVTQSNSLFAQAPNKMSFQAVIRNSSSVLVTSTTVGMRISILMGSTTGAAVYVETQTPTTNANGLATIYVGAGTVVSGNMDSIHWESGSYYLKSETDPAGGTSYSITATQQLVSVPYALYAKRSGDATTGTLPTVTTDSVRAIGYTLATVYSNLVSNGGELILFRGICIDTTSMPDISHCLFAGGSTTGSYLVNATGLLPATRYHVRAFATNTHGTAYGDTMSFLTNTISIPTVTTDTVSSITSTSAVCGGNVTGDGGATVTARGVCYDTISYPTISSHLAPSGSGLGIFTATLSSLSTSHTYYARAYATNSIGTSYGVQRSFTTVLVSVPTISTDSATSVSYTSATTGILTISDGGSTITSQGVCYGTSPLPTISGSYVSTSAGVGHFIASLTGLTAGTTYYIRAFSTNTSGTAYGSQYTFTTLTLVVPTVSTNSVIGISATNATSGGNITSDGGSYVSARGVCYSLSGTPTIDSPLTSDGTGTGLYNSNMTGLSPATTYYVRAYATNSTGTGYGSIISFTTDSIYTSSPSLPIVGTDIPSITSSAYASGGYVSYSGGSSVTARGVCWGTGSLPSLSGSHSSDGTGLGYFSSTISGLSGCGSTYYVRAYATNSSGTGYGNVYSLSTGLLPTITFDSISSVMPTSVVYSCNISGDGGCTVTTRGVCWGIYSSPTISSLHDTIGSGTGSFTSTITGLAPAITYHMRSYATNSIGTVYGTEQVFTTGIPSTLYIGESYAGGIIFYIDSSGSHGLVCSSTDQSNGTWGCYGTVISGTLSGLGTGAANTADIVAGCSTTGIAAYICDTLTLGGYSDWYLPSIDELGLMYTNLYLIGLGSFYSSWWPEGYWSSTQYSETSYLYYAQYYAWYYSFSGGYDSYETKNYTLKVRAVRHF